ncbi:transketolase [Clostridium sp. W14A]|uniref:Transketolase n=1 Tax=Caproicibacter fermentans TaxID=2576756 RepID=A0A7G8T978_9FIRM|nr:transketolase [Caproicibacter fermentans]OCN03363.1 transketolase [Clostridium sp. W14A]QNK40169.1 transketolase [Caproicibacter fermentans]
MNAAEKKKLQILACKVRLGAIEGVYRAKSGHPGGSLSAADLFTYLYFREMRVDPANPGDENRDRFVLSKGHSAPGLYAALALKGYFPMEEISRLRRIGAMLQGHPDMKGTPGVDMSTGSLGQGFSAACGMALAGKMDRRDYRVFTLLGDGEIEEGEIWEAAMFAAHHRLDHLCVIVDNNGLQIDGSVEEVAGPAPIDEKFRAFGFDVQTIDGHSFDEIEKALNHAKTVRGNPCAILAKTVKGKGVSFMENQAGWHGKAPNDKQYAVARNDLNKILRRLEAE